MRKIFTLGLIFSVLFSQTGFLYAQLQVVGGAARQVSTITQGTEKLAAVTRTVSAISAGSYVTTTTNEMNPLYELPSPEKILAPVSLATYDVRQDVSLKNKLTRAILREKLRAQRVTTPPNSTTDDLSFWRQDAQHQVRTLRQLPPGKFQTKRTVSTTDTAAGFAPLADLISDIGALGIYGEKSVDAPFLLDLYRDLQGTPFESPVVTITARALLRLQAYEELQTLAYLHPDPTYIWNSIWEYADKHHINLPLIPSEKPYTPSRKPFQPWLEPFGKLAASAADPSYLATEWYMQLADAKPTTPAPADNIVTPTITPTNTTPLRLSHIDLTKSFTRSNTLYPPHSFSIAGDNTSAFARYPTTSQLSTSGLSAPALRQPVSSTGNLLSFQQRASLYLASFVMGFEIGQPIIASLGESLDLSLPENSLVTAATFLPYALGAFWANHLNKKIGRLTLLDTGLGILGTSLTAGTLLLGLDGSFSPWANTDAHFYSILATLTMASLGSTVMHCAVGPLMSGINQHASASLRQRQTAMTELSQAGGLLTSFFFPLAATQYLGLDWSAPFLLSLPLVLAAGIGIHTARLPNPKPTPLYQPDKTAHKSLGEKLKHSEYARLLKQDTTLTKRVGALALVNGIEASLNSGFLLLLPQMTSSSSSQYTLGFMQFAAPFALGSLLGTQLLKWVPNKSLRVSAAITATGALSALAFTHNLYGLTASLFTAELGLSSAYTLSFAKTAKTPKTQDKATTLLVGSTLTAAVAPFVFSEVAQALVSSGVLSLPNAIMATMIGLPGLLSLAVWRLFRKIEK